jgi:actin-related protein 5
MEIDPQNIAFLPVYPLPAPQPPAEPFDVHRDAHTPLVIDNGSTNLRWGFATSDAPFTGLNAVAKYKERRTNKPLLLFGEAIDAESGAKSQTRTPWEGDVLLNFDALVRSMVLVVNPSHNVASKRRKMHLTLLLCIWVLIHRLSTTL